MASDLDFILATPENEAHIRQLLRENPLAGDLHVALEREPDAFYAAGISGDRSDLLLVYRTTGGRLLGTAGRFELDVFINGTPTRLGYLGELRFEGGLKARRSLLLEGYREMRRLHEAGSVPYYLTTIIESNTSTRRLLEAGLADMPTYRPLETLVTFTIPVAAGARRRSVLPIADSANDRDLPAIADRLAHYGAGYQFFPEWREDVLRNPARCRGLDAKDFVVCRDHERVTGCVALWDQRAFKQTVVTGYARKLARMRPAFNVVAPLMRRPRLPTPGTPLQNAFLSHVAVDPDDDRDFVALVAQSCQAAMERGLDYVTLALAERHPLVPVLRRHFPVHSYNSIIYIVYWDDGADLAASLDDRIPHPEVAIL